MRKMDLLHAKTVEEQKLSSVMFAILDKLITPNIVCNSKGRILFASKSYRVLTNTELENQLFWQIFPLAVDMPHYFKIAVEKQIETREDLFYEDKTFITRTIPITDIFQNEIIFILHFEDITENLRLVQDLKISKNHLQKTFLDTILALGDFLESRDSYTAGHQKRVAALAINIAIEAGIKDREILNAIYYGGLIHDIGKIGVPIEYLTTPKRLTTNEFEIIKTHVTVGNKIIEHMDFPWDIRSVVHQHHERLDGSGYPQGLKGNDITIPARIVAIADVYEAMSTNRPYRELIPQETILSYLEDNKKGFFDAEFVDCLLACIEKENSLYVIPTDFTPPDIIA